MIGQWGGFPANGEKLSSDSRKLARMYQPVSKFLYPVDVPTYLVLMLMNLQPPVVSGKM